MDFIAPKLPPLLAELLDAILEVAPPDLEVRVFGGMTHTD